MGIDLSIDIASSDTTGADDNVGKYCINSQSEMDSLGRVPHQELSEWSTKDRYSSDFLLLIPMPRCSYVALKNRLQDET